MIFLEASGLKKRLAVVQRSLGASAPSAMARGEKGETEMDQPVCSRRGACWRRLAAAVFGLLPLGVLGGCVETAAMSGAEPPDAHAKSAANAAAVDPRGVRVALASLSGVPQPLEDRMKDAFAAQAGERNITLADPAKAAYLIRGYVTTYPVAAGTTVAAVYDVFDANKKRAQRLKDDVVVKSEGADPWSGFNAAAMDDLAARSADDLAAFLITTPEALAAAEPQSGAPARRVAADAPPGAPGDKRASAQQRASAQAPATLASGLSVAALR